MKWSSFRGWVHNLWVQNCDEHSQYSIPAYKEKEYFNTYRWWLKREYKQQLQKEATLEIARLLKHTKMLEDECRALREQVQNLERQVYNGTTM